MAIDGFDFLAAEKDISKKVEELASVVENVATIFLNGIGSLENTVEQLRVRLSKIETQVETLLRVGGSRVAASEPAPSLRAEPSDVEAEPTVTAYSGSSLPPPPPTIGGPPPRTPTSPMGATGGISIKAQMDGELRAFLARRRAALEAREDE